MPIPDFRDAPVLVTGGAGFIGSHLVDALVARGARVHVLDDLSSGSADNLAHHRGAVDLQRGDLRDLDECRRACRQVRFAFHLAARGSVPRSLEDPATTIAVNVGGTANLFAAAREAGVERVVYASSSSVYGDDERLPKREGEEGRPLSPYALSKVMDEELAATFGGRFDMELVGLRFFNVYGPRQSPEGPYAAVVPRFLAAARSGAAMEIHGDGEQSRDFTYVDDAVEAALLAAGAPREACGRAYNVGGGNRVTLNELAARLALIAGCSVAPVHAEPRPGDVRHSHADLTAVRAALGFVPRVSLDEGLRRLWLAAQAAGSQREPARG
ncbi:MAG TPA: NAD-dependent epimerase/dehydratase family protein [Thermoanaerobaculia bacterium]|nr:NAD-dependent epimerase/dehydratase family protein [Thermoanaerobaculia bacterium]